MISSPMPWHEECWARTQKQIQSGLLPHALMLVGPNYTGSSQFALALARFLLCSDPRDSRNCGHCHACELSASESHGDFLSVVPAEKSRTIKIEQVRNLVRFSNKTAGFGLRKVIVIDPANSMNLNSFNALLKTLEEPAKNTFLILVCNRLDGIPVTIRSRCHLLRLACPDIPASLAWLDACTANRQKSQRALSLADNLPLLAKQIFLNGSMEDIVSRQHALEALCTGAIGVPDATGTWGDTEVDAMLEYLHADIQRRVSALETDQLRILPTRMAFRLMDEIASIRRAVGAGANPNKQLLLDALLSRYVRCLGTR